VPKFAKRILVLLAILAGVLIVLLFAANIYVQSGLSQELLAKELSRALRMPVQVGTISISPWGSLSISGITAPQPDSAHDGNFLDAEAFTARFEWLPLLQRKVVINDVELRRPRLVWFQNEKGRWRLPEPQAQASAGREEPGGQSEPGAQVVPTPAPTPEAGVKSEKPAPAPARKAGLPVEIAVDRIRFTEGTFTFNDSKGRPIAVFSGVHALSAAPSAHSVSGTASIARIAIEEKVFIDSVTTPFTYDSEMLTLPSLSAGVAGGKLTGRFQIHLAKEGSPINTAAQFENVDLSRLLADAGGSADRVGGRLFGAVELTGKSDEARSLKGKASFRCEGGQIRNYDFFETLAQLFHIEELARMDLRRASAEARIEKGRAQIETLALESQNLLLTATGSVRFNGKLDLNARLAVSHNVTRQLPQFVENAFSSGPSDDMRQIDFDVNGTIDNPKSNLLERLLGKNLEGQAINLIQSFLGGGRKQKDDKKPKDEGGQP
jgi:type II secretion system protein N